jgi:hypothetical protein
MLVRVRGIRFEFWQTRFIKKIKINYNTYSYSTFENKRFAHERMLKYK